MKAYKITRRKYSSPILVVNVDEAKFPKPKIPCTLITKVHGIQKFTGQEVLVPQVVASAVVAAPEQPV